MTTHITHFRNIFFNMIVRNSYEVIVFLYGPQDKLLKVNSGIMLMGHKIMEEVSLYYHWVK